MDLATAVADIVIDVPRTRNALSSAVLVDLTDAVRRASADPDVRVIVLSGAGGSFSSGADLKETVAPERSADVVSALYEAVRTSPKPILARVLGHCLGLAVGVVAVCDLAVAGEDATFALPEPRFGQAPTLAALTIVPRLRRGDAGRLLLTGAPIDGRQAEAIGLVDAAAGTDDVDGVVAQWVDQLTRCAPGALATCKQLVRTLPQLDSASALAWATALAAERARSPEAAEGQAARAAQRPPVWTPNGRPVPTATDGGRRRDV